MVWLISTHEDEVFSFGPCSQKEFLEVLPLLEETQPERERLKGKDVEHYFIRDFHREQLDKVREDVKIKEILDRMDARRREWFRTHPAGEEETAAAVVVIEAEPEIEIEVSPEPPAASVPAKPSKSLQWKPEPEIAEYPLRILKGATGIVFHQTPAFVFCSFFDDEKRSDSVAAFQYDDILPDAETGERVGPDVCLRFRSVTFDAERLLDEIVQCDVTFDYVAYEVRLKGKKEF